MLRSLSAGLGLGGQTDGCIGILNSFPGPTVAWRHTPSIISGWVMDSSFTVAAFPNLTMRRSPNEILSELTRCLFISFPGYARRDGDDEPEL